MVEIALILLLIANGAPVLARLICKDRVFNQALDGGKLFFDGRPIFGPSKTIRGIVTSIALTAVAAKIIGFSFLTGALYATLSMTGDCLSSFVKRRLGIPVSSLAIGLDQIPESLLPLMIMRSTFELSWEDILLTVLAFIVIELPLSRLLYKLQIRKKPY